MALYKNENGQLQGVANNIPLTMYASRTAYDNAVAAGEVPNNVLVSINDKDETTDSILERIEKVETDKQDKKLAATRTLYPNGIDNPTSLTTVDQAIRELVGRVIPKGDGLGFDYIYNPRDFYGPCFRKVPSFHASCSPVVTTGVAATDTGDWNVFNLYSGDPAFNFLIAVTPRRDWEIWIGCTWDGVLQGWKRLTATI